MAWEWGWVKGKENRPQSGRPRPEPSQRAVRDPADGWRVNQVAGVVNRGMFHVEQLRIIGLCFGGDTIVLCVENYNLLIVNKT